MNISGVRRAAGYVRCCCPSNWQQIVAHSKEHSGKVPSRSSANPLFQEQKRKLRWFAKSRQLSLNRVFCDAEFDTAGNPAARPFVQRSGWQQAVAWVMQNEGSVLLVDERQCITADPIRLAILCEILHSRSMQVFETSTGEEITQSIEVMAGFCEDREQAIRKEMANWQGGVTRLINKTKTGRRKFGETKAEMKAIYRLLALYRPLRGTKPRQRGNRLYSRRSFGEIAQIMNQERWQTPDGKKWSAGTVHATLRSLGKLCPGETAATPPASGSAPSEAGDNDG